MSGFQSEMERLSEGKKRAGLSLAESASFYAVRWDEAPSEFEAGSIPSRGPGLLRCVDVLFS